jgi:hypothetical protein
MTRTAKLASSPFQLIKPQPLPAEGFRRRHEHDPLHRSVAVGWVMPDRRTIWLMCRRRPAVFYGHEDSKRELVITNATNGSVTGYLLLPANQRSREIASTDQRQGGGGRLPLVPHGGPAPGVNAKETFGPATR